MFFKICYHKIKKTRRLKFPTLRSFLAPMLSMREEEELNLVALKKAFKSVLEEDGSEYDLAFFLHINQHVLECSLRG